MRAATALFACLSGIILPASSSNGEDGPPPPPFSPNFCTSRICLEVSPIPNPELHKFIKPIFSAIDSPDRTSIKILFEGVGLISIDTAAESSLTSSGQESFINSTPCDRVKACKFLNISATPSDNSISPETLKCQIRRIWLMKGGSYKITPYGMSQSYEQMRILKIKDNKCNDYQ